MKFYLIRLFLAFCLLFVFKPAIYATHSLQAEINYHFINANTIQVSVVTYTKASSLATDRDSIAVHWGDSSPDAICARVNGPLGPMGVPNGVLISHNMKMNIYTGTHTYSNIATGPNNYYIVSMIDPNRNAGISNISNSVDVPLYVEDTIWFNNLGQNHGPVLLYPPIDLGNVGDTFFHNPAAYDLEADSLRFDLITPKQGLGQDVPGYRDPASSIFGGPSTITIDHLNGEIIWATPHAAGVYNIAILIREYRDGVILSSMIREMQIIIGSDSGKTPPFNGSFTDITITPGQAYTYTCYSNDPDIHHIDTLSAYGGPFVMRPDSAFFPLIFGQQVSGTMTWTPGHNLYKPRETRIVSFRSKSNDPVPYSTIRAYRITVADPLYAGIADVGNNSEHIRSYPNPVVDLLHVSCPECDRPAQLTICDAVGRTVNVTDGLPENDINTSNLSPGIYLIKISSTRGYEVQRFVKE